MFFFKHSLITITIVTISICSVMSVIPQDDVDKLQGKV
jgi:hypothetical protein